MFSVFCGRRGEVTSRRVFAGKSSAHAQATSGPPRGLPRGADPPRGRRLRAGRRPIRSAMDEVDQQDDVESSAADMEVEENDVVLEEEDDVAEDEAVDDEAEADDEPEPAAASAPPSDDGAAKSDPPSEAPPAKELPPADMACPEGHVLKKQSGYLFYSAQFRASCKARVDEENADAAAGARSQMVMKALAAGWSALDDATKKKYGDDAPWEAKKIKEKKPTKKEKAKAAAAADAKKGWETVENALDVQALRDLKMLYDEGVLTAAEFAAKKAMMLEHHAVAAIHANDGAALRDAIRRGADVNGMVPCRNERTGAPGHFSLLCLAACKGLVGLCEILLAEGADVNIPSTLDGCLPLHIAAYRGFNACVRLLVRAGVDVDVRTSNSFVPLHFASQFGHAWDTVKLLIAAGANVEARDRQGTTPLRFALLNGRREIALTLLRAGAPITALRRAEITPENGALHDYMVDIMDKGGWNARVERHRRPLMSVLSNLALPHDALVVVLSFWSPPGGR